MGAQEKRGGIIIIFSHQSIYIPLLSPGADKAGGGAGKEEGRGGGGQRGQGWWGWGDAAGGDRYRRRWVVGGCEWCLFLYSFWKKERRGMLRAVIDTVIGG